MKLITISMLFLLASTNIFAQSVLTENVTGSFVSPAHSSSFLEITGSDNDLSTMKYRLLSGQNGKLKKVVTLKNVKFSCDEENKCIIDFESN